MAYPVSNEFKATIKKSHRIATKVELYSNGALISPPAPIILNEGTSIEDKTSATRRRATIKITDPSGLLTPSSMEDILAPSGSEFKLYRGLYLSSTGLPEYVPLGVYAFPEVDIEDNGESFIIVIEGLDRSERVRRARFTDVYTIVAGTSVRQAIIDIISVRISGLNYEGFSLDGGYTTPGIVAERGDDPWALCEKLARGIGYEVSFDADGNPIFRPEPDISGSPAWIFEGGSEAVILNLNKKLVAPKYNHVFEIGEGPELTSPVVGEAKDDNPSSPTYYLGTFGDSPTFHVSSLYTTQAQAQAAADAKLLRVIGKAEDIQSGLIPNGAIQAGDVIYMDYTRPKITNTYVLDRVVTPLRATQAQQFATRRRS